jgi:hypothetical protein
MNEISGTKATLVKVLAIFGFIATVLLLVWLIVVSVTRAPGTFSSLASIAESVGSYRTVSELSIATDKTVVNSEESFQITWTDMKQDGEYRVHYTCTDAVSLLVRGEDGKLMPMTCKDTLTLPAAVHGLYLSFSSKEARFADVPLSVSFTDAAGKKLESTTKITVVNATIPVGSTAPVAENEPGPEVVKPEPQAPAATTTPPAAPKPVAPTVTAPKPQAPIVTSAYPQSNPNGYTDLKVTMLGGGIIRGGVFAFTPSYDSDLHNAVRFDIKNIGTKTSDSWTFKTVLPSGTVYESERQPPLKPQEHVEFTLGFGLDDDDNLVKITTTVYAKSDTNHKNDSATWSMVVKN